MYGLFDDVRRDVDTPTDGLFLRSTIYSTPRASTYFLYAQLPFQQSRMPPCLAFNMYGVQQKMYCSVRAQHDARWHGCTIVKANICISENIYGPLRLIERDMPNSHSGFHGKKREFEHYNAHK